MAMTEPGLMVPPGMEVGGPPPNAGIPTYEDMPPEQVEERSDAVVSSFLDTAKDVLSREQKEVLINVFEQYPQILEIVEQVFTATSEGEVSGEGTGTSDSITAKVSDGEFIFTAKAVKQLGVDKLRKLMEKAEAEYDNTIALQEQTKSAEQKFGDGGYVVNDEEKKTILQGLAERVKKFIRTEEAPTPGRLPPEALGSGLAGKAGEAIRKRQEMMQQY